VGLDDLVEVVERRRHALAGLAEGRSAGAHAADAASVPSRDLMLVPDLQVIGACSAPAR
jgi:hypothetical protein